MGPLTKLKMLNRAARKESRLSDDGESIGIEVSTLERIASSVGECRNGWCADRFQGETYTGEAWATAAESEDYSEQYPPVYVAGYREPNDCYVCMACDHGEMSTFGNARDAMMAADELARVHAERDCEWDERWHEANRADEDIEDLKTQARDVRKRWRALANACALVDDAMVAMIRDEQREEHASCIATIVEKRERIVELGMADQF